MNTLIKCTRFLNRFVLDRIAGCPVDEPFELDPTDITIITGYVDDSDED